MDIRFDATEFQKIARNYDGGDRIVKDETVKAMTRSVVAIEADAKRRVPTDTHNLQRSITHEVVSPGTSVIGRAGTNQPYAEAVEKGRGAGEKMPPPGALLGWMGRKGIELGEERVFGPTLNVRQLYSQTEYLIARAIGHRGIRPRPFMKPGYDVNRLKISRELGSALMERIMKRVANG